MCYFKANEAERKELEEYLNRVAGEDHDFEPYHYIPGFHKHYSDSPHLPIVTSENSSVISFAQWGLLPYWTQSEEKADIFYKNNLNAVGETVFEKPSFRVPIMKKRCLIPATGFFEWMDLNKVKYPHYIHLNGRKIFCFAGIYDNWKNSNGETVTRYSILTTAANELMEKIHNTKKRQPLILPKELEDVWIDPKLSQEETKNLIKIFPAEEMKAHTISKRISSTTEKRNVPEITVRFEYPELALS